MDHFRSRSPGAVTGFLGPNGAGKTTTLRRLLGLATPTSGRSLVLGRPYADLDHPALSVGAVLEATDFHPGRSGRDHLRTLGRAAGLPDSRADDVLRTVELQEAGGRRVKGYSLGMRQRLGVAGALLGDPELLILDEPANGLVGEVSPWPTGLPDVVIGLPPDRLDVLDRRPPQRPEPLVDPAMTSAARVASPTRNMKFRNAIAASL